jgi:hypothetical protein
MATTTVTVSLDTSADPPVTVSTQNLIIDSTGDQIINWVPGGSTTFTFTSLEITTIPNPITVTSVADSLVVATDDNEAPGTYTYRIVVTSNNLQYSTDQSGATGGDPGDPSLENKEPE